ncbi:MAG TPA: hypothetical protein P5558_17100 [Geminicoccaceae bacterium]|nr:hypothetical protein [Geminicoccaceae bacterium]
MAGPDLARRLCQAAIGDLIDWRTGGYDLARDATGAAFDRLFPCQRSKEQRLLDAALNGFDTHDLEDDTAAQLTAAASDLLLWHGLSSAQITQIAEADVGRWADRAMQTVCARGLRLNWHPAESAYCSALSILRMLDNNHPGEYHSLLANFVCGLDLTDGRSAHHILRLSRHGAVRIS